MSIAEDTIRLHAYWIWEREGRPHGRASMHWEMAQMEVMIEDAQQPSDQQNLSFLEDTSADGIVVAGPALETETPSVDAAAPSSQGQTSRQPVKRRKRAQMA